MNSDEEKALFALYGWEYNYVLRVWIAPDGYELTEDALVAAMENFGELAEEALPRLLAQHGRKP